MFSVLYTVGGHAPGAQVTGTGVTNSPKPNFHNDCARLGNSNIIHKSSLYNVLLHPIDLLEWYFVYVTCF